MSRRYLAIAKIKDIKMYEELLKLIGKKDANIEQKLAEKKRDLRAFLREEGKYSAFNSCPYNLLESKTIINSDGDGYTEKCVFKYDPFSAWGKTEIEELFENLFERHVNSPYDCSGQSFTAWYNAVKLNNYWTIYHRVGLDV